MASGRLISFVQEHPCLYDKSHSDYKDTGMKDNIWSDIKKDLGYEDTSEYLCQPSK